MRGGAVSSAKPNVFTDGVSGINFCHGVRRVRISFLQTARHEQNLRAPETLYDKEHQSRLWLFCEAFCGAYEVRVSASVASNRQRGSTSTWMDGEHERSRLTRLPLGCG